MPDVYMPWELLRQKINNLVQGLYLDVSDDNEIILISTWIAAPPYQSLEPLTARQTIKKIYKTP